MKSGGSKVPDGMEKVGIKSPVVVAESELGMAHKLVLEGDALPLKEQACGLGVILVWAVDAPDQGTIVKLLWCVNCSLFGSRRDWWLL